MEKKQVNKKYLHIGFNFSGELLTKELEPIFNNLSDDWIRYAENCWIVWTQHTNEEWLKALKPKLGIHNHVLILELVNGQQLKGWIPQWVWDWLLKSKV